MEKIGLNKATLFLLFLGLPLAGCHAGQGQVTFINHAKKAIVEGRVRVGTKNFDLAGLDPGQSRDFQYPGDEATSRGYLVSFTLKDGKRASLQIGSLRADMDYSDVLTLENKEISLQSAQNPAGNEGLKYRGTQTQKIRWFE